MDRSGLLHKSSRLVGEMGEAGHGCWWSVNNLPRPPFEQQHHHDPSLSVQLPPPATTSSSSSSPPQLHSFSSLLLSNHYPLPSATTSSTAAVPWHDSTSSTQGLQVQLEPWSNLFMQGRTSGGGLGNGEAEEEMYKNWEGQAALIPSRTAAGVEAGGIGSSGSYIYSSTTSGSHGSSTGGDEIRLGMSSSSPYPWGGAGCHHLHHSTLQASSPRSSCITTSTTSPAGSNIMEFSNNGSSPRESMSTASGAAFKKARTQDELPSQTTTQSTVKVRKEKLGDRITALHQLVSPFGKTDTASVLLEAIGYIRFLHGQIEVLSLPYQPGGGNGGGDSSSSSKQQREASVQRGDKNSIFPEDPGQLLHDRTLGKRGHPDQGGSSGEEAAKELRSRGLCLVPVSCTLRVGADASPADYWTAAPPFGQL